MRSGTEDGRIFKRLRLRYEEKLPSSKSLNYTPPIFAVR